MIGKMNNESGIMLCKEKYHEIETFTYVLYILLLLLLLLPLTIFFLFFSP